MDSAYRLHRPSNSTSERLTCSKTMATFGAHLVRCTVHQHPQPNSASGHAYLMIDDLQKAYTAYQQALYHLPGPKVRAISSVAPSHSPLSYKIRSSGTASVSSTTDTAASSTPRRLSPASSRSLPTSTRPTKSTSASASSTSSSKSFSRVWRSVPLRHSLPRN